MILLDTHVFWKLAQEKPLGRVAAGLVSRSAARGELRLSAITWWELQMLAMAGAIRSRHELREVRQSAQQSGFVEIPVDGEIAILAGKLEGMHGDTADRIVVATALSTNATLVTGDERILELTNGPRIVDATE